MSFLKAWNTILMLVKSTSSFEPSVEFVYPLGRRLRFENVLRLYHEYVKEYSAYIKAVKLGLRLDARNLVVAMKFSLNCNGIDVGRWVNFDVCWEEKV
jgi:hypothetical protein